jgi:hypothetical protein
MRGSGEQDVGVLFANHSAEARTYAQSGRFESVEVRSQGMASMCCAVVILGYVEGCESRPSDGDQQDIH